MPDVQDTCNFLQYRLPDRNDPPAHYISLAILYVANMHGHTAACIYLFMYGTS